MYECMSEERVWSGEWRDCVIGDQNFLCVENRGKELIIPLINSITKLKIFILDRSTVKKGFSNYK